MLHRKRVAFTLHRWAKIGFHSSTLIAAAGAGLTRLPENADWGLLYGEVRGWFYAWGWLIAVIFSLGAAACGYAQKLIGSPDVWEMLHSLLDDLRTHIFDDARYSDSPTYHRVTLFKCRNWRRWTDYQGVFRALVRRNPNVLAAVVRSGHINQERVSWFKVGDAETECEGIVGAAWLNNRITSVHDLPSIDAGSSEAVLKDYAQRTRVPPERVRIRLPKTRSLMAFPVHCNGAIWGVLVFDSRDPGKIGHDKVDGLCRVLANHLSKLIERTL